jgi:hypothetical protein
VEFSRELRNDVLAGDITLSVRCGNGRRSSRAAATESAPVRSRSTPSSSSRSRRSLVKDIRRAGEPDRETLRRRAAHAGPIDEDTLVYRSEFHVVAPR